MTLHNQAKLNPSTVPGFIIGGHRCGTTLLRYLIDTHQDIACPPESKFLSGLQEFLDFPQMLQALADMGLSRTELLAKLRYFSNSIFEDYVTKKQKRRWIDKTPNYANILPFIDELYCGQASYIIISRHPLDCVDSLNTYFRASRNHEDPEIAKMRSKHGLGKLACAHYWAETYQRIRVFAASCPQRAHYVKYEDLVQSPTTEMKKVFSFLGEIMPEGLLERVFHQQHDLGYGDKKIRSSKAISHARIDKWKTWPNSEVQALWEVVASSAKYFRYESPELH